MDWVKKFIIKRLLFFVLLMTLCLGIFPFIIFYPLTMRIGIVLGKLSGNPELASKIDAAWNVLGTPYDALAKMTM